MNILPDRENRAADNDLLTNKMMVALCIACIDLMLVMGIRWGYSASGAFPFFYTATKVLMFVMLAVAVFGIFKEVSDRKKGLKHLPKIFTGAFIAGCAALFAFTCYEMAYTDYLSSSRFLYILIPVICVLYLIYVIYRREFFAVALPGAVIALYIWRYARYAAGSAGFYIGQAVLLLVLAALAVLFVHMDRSGGTITVGGVRYRFLPPDAQFRPAILGLCVLAAVVAALFFVSAGVFLYFAYAVVALVFFLAVYFTVIML